MSALAPVREHVEQLRARFVAWRAVQAETARVHASAPPPTLAGRPTWVWLAVALLLGLGVRLYYYAIKGGMHYPDEIFQYLEPAYEHIHGFAWLPWEYDRGVRNWVLPAYYGGLIEIGETFGLRGWALHRALTLHSTLLSLLIVPAGWRLGVAVGRGDQRLGALTAFALALFPVFGYFAPHTLSELHGLLATTWAYTLWMEQQGPPERTGRVRKAFWVGLLLGAAVICRYTLVVFVPLVALDYQFRSRLRELFAASAGFLVAMALLGWVDLMTWGRPFHSFIEYVDYNLLENGASHHGVMSHDFYWREAFVERLGLARWLLLAPALALFRRHWRMILAWVIPFVGLSLIGHKEERFLLSIWPFVLAAGLSGALGLADWLRTLPRVARLRHAAHVPVALATAVLVVVCAANFHGTAKLPMRWLADVFRAQSWVGEQEDVTGVLIDERQHITGGYVLLGRNVPQVGLVQSLLAHHVFNYVIAHHQDTIEQMSRRRDFERLEEFEGAVVFRRVEGAKGR